MAEINTIQGKHPRGLYVLFFTEMWERFGYYLMVGIFFLFMTDTLTNGGKGFDAAKATDIVGTYVALVYLTPFIGGLIADRFIGYRKAIFIGGTLMAAGYFGLMFQGDTAMYISLLCIIVGNGFFKPNISTLLGNIYNKEDLKPLKDSAYNIFYMGINIGAFFCNFVAAYLRNEYGWGYAFGAAGVGMVFGLIWFATGVRHVAHADVIKPVQKEDMPISKIFLYVFLPAMIAGAIGWNIPGTLLGSDGTDAFLFACVPIIVFYFSLWFKSEGLDRKCISALLTIYGVSIIFWIIYNQNATTLTIWAETYTDRQMPQSLESITGPVGMLQTVSTTEQDVPKLDQYFRTENDEKGKVITEKGIDPYFKNLPKDKWPTPPETNLKLLSTEIFQSINPFFIVLFTPIVVGLFGWLRARKKEPTTPAKIGWGVFISGLSSLVMVFAVMSTDIFADKTSALWLTGSYAVFTIGELCLSPLGLSLVSKISPPRLTALMMGGWFLSTSIGGKLSGILASFWDTFTDKRIIFMITFIAATIATIGIYAIVKWLSEIVRERTGSD